MILKYLLFLSLLIPTAHAANQAADNFLAYQSMQCFDPANRARKVTIQAPTLAASWALTLPTTDGNANEFLQTNGSGVTTWAVPTDTGVTTMGAFGSSPNGNAGTISGSTLTLQPADATNPGGVSTTTQTLAGAKTFSSTPTFSTMTLGSVLFAGTAGILSQDNSGFFYDATNHRLGVGTATPAYRFQVTASADNYSHGMAISHSLGDANALYRFYVDFSNNVLSICNPNQTTCSFATDHLGRVQLSGGAYAAGGSVNIANQTGRTADHTLELTKIGSQTGEMLNVVSTDGTTVLSKIDANGAGTFAGLTVSTLGTGIAHLNSSGVMSSSAVDLSGSEVTGTLAAARMPALTGDVTTSAGSIATTLATVNSDVGTFTNATITVNAKGLVTAASSGAGGGGAISVLTKTANYTVVTGDFNSNKQLFLIVNSASAVQIDLPAASNTGYTLYVKNINVGAVTIARASSDLIDGETSMVLSTQYSSIGLTADGSAAWYVF